MHVSIFPNSFWIILLTAIAFGCGPATQKNEQTSESIQQEETPAPPVRVDQGRLEYLATLPDGRIVSMHMIHRDPSLIAEPGPPQPMFISFSPDNGVSWTKTDTAFHYPAEKGIYSGGFPLVDQTGNLHCFVIRYNRLRRDTTGSSEIFHNMSEDGGKTWSKPQVVDYGHDYTGSFNCVVELTSGRILFALSYNTEYMEERGQPDNQIVSVYSDDSGNTWQVGSDDIDVPQGEFGGHPGALEPVMVELEDGRVWMIIRTQQRMFYQTFSSDGGATWTETSPTDFDAPNAPGGILRLSDGRMVFCWNDLSQYPEGKVEGSGRQYLHIAISSDDGKTWSKSKQIAQREEGENPNTNVAYPFLTETRDNHVLVSYHRVGNREGVSWWYPIVEALRIDPDWIEMGQD